MNEVNNKKNKNLFALGLVVLLLAVFGATYAYFAVTTVNNFGTSTINAQAGGIGTVTLDGNNAQLNLSVSALDMAQSNAKAYYASASGKTATPTEEVIGTASVTPSTDTNYYHCTYTLTVSQSYAGTKNLYNIFKGTEQVNSTTYTSSANELVLIVNGEEYDLHTNTLPKDIDGEFYVKVGSPATITAGLKFNNFNDKQQQLLGGSGVNISIVVKNGTFECEAENAPIYKYWTYEGNYVSYFGSPMYTEAQKGNIPNNYYIKTILSNETYTEDMYEIQYVDEDFGTELYTGDSNQVFTSSQCASEIANTPKYSAIDTPTCVKKYSAGDNMFRWYEVCVKIGANEVCIEPNHWNTADTTYKQVFEAAGWQCKYYDYVSLYSTTRTASSARLECAATDPSSLPSNSNALICIAESIGQVYCGVAFAEGCYVGSEYYHDTYRASCNGS